ncbi:hypothetical protein SAY87_006716 [Trapa incisa]|uniref:Uncharacterized protein n=1 Tax=Trapa incisa TaxID=236973 RepID=A0AAN7PZZ4_9MYRT|nr:hypothetical protein SAY87_006716 [Trapa incisa]
MPESKRAQTLFPVIYSRHSLLIIHFAISRIHFNLSLLCLCQLFTMAFWKTALVALVLAATALTAAAQVEAPAPAPVSLSSSVVPSLASAFLAGVAALILGSTLRI